jgi:hypothetical protein
MMGVIERIQVHKIESAGAVATLHNRNVRMWREPNYQKLKQKTFPDMQAQSNIPPSFSSLNATNDLTFSDVQGRLRGREDGRQATWRVVAKLMSDGGYAR